MNQYLALFLLFSLLGLPLFLLILLEKCVDLSSYRKLSMMGKLSFVSAPKRILSLEIWILVVSQVLNALAIALLIANVNALQILFYFIPLLILFYFPLLTILSLILMYLLERKSIREASLKHSFKTKACITNLILDLVFQAAYHILLAWSFSFAEIGFWGSGGDGTKQDFILLIGAVILLVIFAFLKLLIQHELVRLAGCDAKNNKTPGYEFRLKD